MGVLRESILQFYALYCNLIRKRLLILFLKQSVNIRDLDSGGRGRKFAPRRACEPTDARSAVRRTERRSRESIFSPRPVFPYPYQSLSKSPVRALSFAETTP